jgi:hypothetical protein
MRRSGFSILLSLIIASQYLATNVHFLILLALLLLIILSLNSYSHFPLPFSLALLEFIPP